MNDIGLGSAKTYKTRLEYLNDKITILVVEYFLNDSVNYIKETCLSKEDIFNEIKNLLKIYGQTIEENEHE